MKKILALLLVTLFIFAACSCSFGSNKPQNSNGGSSSISSNKPSSNKPGSSQTPSLEDESSQNQGNANSIEGANPSNTPNSSSDATPELPGNESSSNSGGGVVPSFAPISNAGKWCYNNITETQKGIYQKLYNLVTEFSDEFVDLEKCSYNDLVVADYALRRDFPEIFWMSGDFYTIYHKQKDTYSMGYSNGEKSGYLCSAEEAEVLFAALKAKVNAFLKTLNPKMTEYEIALAAHDYLASTVAYDYETANNHDNNPYSFTAYGALVSGKAVCEGYAKAFQLLVNSVGINAICVTGSYDGVGHMWNMVKIGGDWYNVDATMDDQSALYHRFFTQTDKYLFDNKYVIDPGFSANIAEGESFNIARPSATASLMNYYVVTGYIIDSPIPIDDGFYNAVEKTLKAGKTGIEVVLDYEIDPATFSFDEYFSSVDLTSLGIKAVKITSFSGLERLHIINFAVNRE